MWKEQQILIRFPYVKYKYLVFLMTSKIFQDNDNIHLKTKRNKQNILLGYFPLF